MSASTLDEAFEKARALDAPLSERLAAYAGSLRQFNAPLADGVDRLVARLKAGETAAGAPREGDIMPPFLLPDHTGRLISLQELLRAGPLAVTFARGHWCPYCRIALGALANVADEIAAIGAQAVAIVPDVQSYASRLRDDTHMPFPILCDVDNGYAMALGLTFWVGEEMEALMRARGANPPESQGNDSWFVPVPATFVVARNGTIAARHVDPDYRKRMEIDAMLDALRRAASDVT